MHPQISLWWMSMKTPGDPSWLLTISLLSSAQRCRHSKTRQAKPGMSAEGREAMSALQEEPMPPAASPQKAGFVAWGWITAVPHTISPKPSSITGCRSAGLLLAVVQATHREE